MTKPTTKSSKTRNNKRKTHGAKRRKLAIMRRLDPSDPRSLDHPDQRERWLELARSIGHAMADRDWERLQQKLGAAKPR